MVHSSVRATISCKWAQYQEAVQVWRRGNLFYAKYLSFRRSKWKKKSFPIRLWWKISVLLLYKWKKNNNFFNCVLTFISQFISISMMARSRWKQLARPCTTIGEDLRRHTFVCCCLVQIAMKTFHPLDILALANECSISFQVLTKTEVEFQSRMIHLLDWDISWNDRSWTGADHTEISCICVFFPPLCQHQR